MRVPQLRRVAAMAAIGVVFAVAFNASPAHADATSTDALTEASVATVETGVSATTSVSAADYTSALASAGTTLSTEQQASLASLSCWTWTVWRYAKNLIGSTLWKYFQKIYWCRNGYRVYYPSVQRRWGEVYWPGWSYKGVISRWSYGGSGYTYWQVGSQAHFCLIQYFSCVQNRYPWVEQIVRGNGYNTYTTGG